RGLGCFAALLSGFHFLEYFSTAAFHKDVTMSAFLINHSWQYHAAMAFGAAEYLLELWLFPAMKRFTWLNVTGICLVLACQWLRTTAMLTAGRNFTHLVAYHKRPSHRLVTVGVYSVFRHPSYTAFFYWALLLQGLVLANPVASVGYAVALQRFFAARVPDEEDCLVDFFGRDYVAYRKRTLLLIP
ncbi:Isoprenylcysteine carboxyl methyltransferase family-domain-containing protein, partial [Zopfochytrium polystomum]